MIPFKRQLSIKTETTAHNADEGYVEQRFEVPDFMDNWSDSQKAELAFQLLSTIPTSDTLKVIDRLTPLLQRNYLSMLPYEIALHILSFLDAHSLTRMSRVSRQWRQLSEDQSLWRRIFLEQKWGYNKKAMQMYLEKADLQHDAEPRESPRKPVLAPVPLARTAPCGYDLSSSPSVSRTHHFRRPADLLLRLRQRHISQPNPAADNTTTPSSSSSSDVDQLSLAASPSRSQPLVYPSPRAHTNHPSGHSRSSSSLILPAPSSSSTFLSNTSSSRSSISRHHFTTASSTTSLSSTRPSSLSHVVERPCKNRPTPRRNVKHDETALYHYNEATDTRFINWKRLYRNRYLIESRWQQGRCKMKVFPPSNAAHDMHNEGIYCIQFDEDKIISGSRDHTIKIWDMRTGECRLTLEGHAASVLCLQYNDDYIISGSSDSTMIQWDVNTGKIVRRLLGHRESVLNLKFNTTRIVSCSKDRTVRIWDFESGTTQQILYGHRAAVNAVQFKDNYVVSASGDRTIKLWNMETGACIRTFDSHSRGIACVEFDGQIIVSGSSDQTIKVWDVETGDCIHTFSGHQDLVRTLQLDSKIDRIISGSYDGSLKIWCLKDRCMLRSLTQAVDGRILNLQFDYARIVCCSNLKKIVKYDFAHGIDTQFLM